MRFRAYSSRINTIQNNFKFERNRIFNRFKKKVFKYKRILNLLRKRNNRIFNALNLENIS